MATSCVSKVDTAQVSRVPADLRYKRHKQLLCFCTGLPISSVMATDIVCVVRASLWPLPKLDLPLPLEGSGVSQTGEGACSLPDRLAESNFVAAKMFVNAVDAPQKWACALSAAQGRGRSECAQLWRCIYPGVSEHTVWKPERIHAGT